LQEELVGNTRQPLLIVLATVGLVLLIACFNLASLFLARAASRAREMAIRIALGAKPQHLLRQFLTESLLLSLGGGFGGLLVAFWGRDLLVTWLEISPISQTSIDLPVLLFTLAVVILTGVLIGLIPALRVIRLDPQMMLKEGGNSGLGSYRNWGHKIFVVAEISLALTVLIAAGLLLNTLLALRQIDLGFNAQNLLTAELLLPENKYQTPTQQVAFYDQLLQQLATLPTQPQAAIVSLLPLNPRYQATRFFLEGQPAPAAGQFNRSNFHVVSPKYFTTMGIPLIAGRDFTNDDRQGKPEYMIVSQKMAARFWPNQDPLGRRVSFESPNGPWVTVIGVVADARYLALESEAEAEFYVTYLQSPQPNMALVLRANNPTSFIGGLRNIVTTIDKYQPVDNLRTMEQIIDDRLGANRMLTTILGIFAFIALLLSMLGIYAITAYNVTQRTREIGIRLALGAPPSAILTLILKQSLILMALGLAVGIAGAVAVARSIASLLYGLEPLNISLFGGCIVILAIIGLLASLLPARRATQVDPLIALKYD
jgi:putative ABC transport system permease protein